MEIKYNNETVNFEITGLSWNDANRIFLALKKIIVLIEKTQYDGTYHEQEASRLKKEYEDIISVFDKDFPKGELKGLDEDILEFL